MMRVRFRCGHSHDVDPNRAVACVVCGETRVARTLNAEPPRFTGVARGPLSRTVALPAIAVQLAEQPLRLKERES